VPEKVDVHLTTASSQIVYVPIHFKKNDIKRIAYGTKMVSCQIRFHEKPTLLISQDLATALFFPKSKVNLHLFVKDHVLYIGPLVGIFTAGFTSSMLRPVAQRSLFFAKLLTSAKEKGCSAFIFRHSDLDFTEGTVTGYFYGRNGWIKHKVPFPNVIYDRLPNRELEKDNTLLKVKEKLQKDYDIPWFNPTFFNKWDTYQSLGKLESRWLLPTRLFSTPSDLKVMLSSYGHVYVKPIHGSLGKGMFVIEATSEGYHCESKDLGQNKVFSSFQKLINFLKKHKLTQPYIIQKKMSLLSYNNSPFDFRVHTNRNEDGKWEVTAIAIKVSGEDAITTHLRNGGYVKRLEDVFKDRTKEVEKKITEAALTLSKHLQKTLDGTIGEIGFDFGIDTNEELYLFEANSRPGRSIFKYPILHEQDVRTRQMPYAFAIFLMKESLERTEAVIL
jgi:hypothetical protein